MTSTTLVKASWPHTSPMPSKPKPGAPKPPRKAAVKPRAALTDPSKLKVTSDPLPAKRSFTTEYKYDAIFEAMEIGHSIVCATGETQRIANAMRAWIKRDGREGVGVTSAPKYVDPRTNKPTGDGRVWLVKKETK